MNYANMVSGTFLARPNRFIAHVDIAGQTETVHVKNTGRCKELLVPGTRVWCQEASSPARKTRFDLITVEKGGRLINMDSQAPNAATKEWLLSGGFGKVEALRAEAVHGDSRFDFSFFRDGKLWFLEVKGVTLEENARKAIADGLDVAIVYPAEGTSVLPDGAAIVRGCAHEENARKFIDFLLSPDVQQLLGAELSRRSVRTDTASDALPELTVLPYDLRRADERRQELFDAWQALCGEVEA